MGMTTLQYLAKVTTDCESHTCCVRETLVPGPDAACIKPFLMEAVTSSSPV
jgi:hypothetical protein